MSGVATALGRIAHCGQFFIYRLSEWDDKASKFRAKQPWAAGGPHHPGNPKHHLSYDAALAAVAAAPVVPGVVWAVGLWITADLGMFFIDIDRLPADYTLDAEATAILQQFPGCMVEWSSGRRGLHIMGSCASPPDHSSVAGRLELYTDQRGAVLSPTAQGSIDTDGTAALTSLIASTFPPRSASASSGPIVILPPGTPPELSAVSLALRQSQRIIDAPDGERNHTLNNAAYVMGGMVAGGRITLDDARAALIAAVERVGGWGNMKLQIGKIDAGLQAGMEAPIHREPAVTAPTVTAPAPVSAAADADWHTLVDATISRINNTGTYRELTDTVIPEIGQLCIPRIHAERVVTALSRRLELFDAKQPIGAVRAMVTPPAVIASSQPPEWFAGICYITRTDRFYNANTGREFTHESFRTEYSRFMPTKQNGDKEDPVKWARERWNIVTVDDKWYRPDQPTFFAVGNRYYANEFLASSMPIPAEPTPECREVIKLFEVHLYLMCGQRDWLYVLLLQWLAYNVQNPGRKIRWSPLIKGVQGDGKSIVGDLIFAAMGESNVKITSISNLSNSGGFTDWATGKAVNFIEEIRLEGKEKHKLYNSMKTFIGDTRSDLNRKGRAAGDTEENITNHWANTNYGDAVPVEMETERRWLVVFSPYSDIHEAVRAKGLASVDDLVQQFKRMGASMRAEPGAWRQWLMTIDTSTFDPDGRAPDTPERRTMALMSSNTIDQVVMDILDEGGRGITKDVFSAGRLFGMLRHREVAQPHNREWNSLLTRLGYQQVEKTVWWDGSSHRIWLKKMMTNEEIRGKLDKTV